MVDNIEIIRPLLQFDSEDDFYYLQILMRKKENPGLRSNSRVLKNYYIRSVEYLDKIYDEVKILCNQFNARAMLRLNKRSFYKVGYRALENMASTMSSKDFKHLKSQYDKACGQCHNDPNKKWIIDVDKSDDYDIDDNYMKELCLRINSCTPLGDKIITMIESKSGYHLITKPFNKHEFSKFNFDISIHKDNPTNLYIP